MRKTQFQNDYYYHIYNRGVDKRDIFMDDKDYVRFLTSMREFNRKEPIESLYRLNQIREREGKEAKLLREKINFSRSSLASSEPLVGIICYSLLPNHYHFLVKQLTEKGIEKFMHKLGYGYTRYFNEKCGRSGSLFQGTYKAISVKTNSYIWRLSCYINGNPEIHGISKAQDWNWSSYKDYLGLRKGKLCNKKVILRDFDNIKEYKELVNHEIKNSRERKNEIKKYLLE